MAIMLTRPIWQSAHTWWPLLPFLKHTFDSFLLVTGEKNLYKMKYVHWSQEINSIVKFVNQSCERNQEICQSVMEKKILKFFCRSWVEKMLNSSTDWMKKLWSFASKSWRKIQKFTICSWEKIIKFVYRPREKFAKFIHQPHEKTLQVSPICCKKKKPVKFANQ